MPSRRLRRFDAPLDLCSISQNFVQSHFVKLSQADQTMLCEYCTQVQDLNLDVIIVSSSFPINIDGRVLWLLFAGYRPYRRWVSTASGMALEANGKG